MNICMCHSNEKKKEWQIGCTVLFFTMDSQCLLSYVNVRGTKKRDVAKPVLRVVWQMKLVVNRTGIEVITLIYKHVPNFYWREKSMHR